MWARFRNQFTSKGGRKIMQSQRSLTINDEYLCAVRTKSFADCFTKFQLLVNQQSPPSPPANYTHSGFSKVLLEPGQEAIASILDSSSIFSKSSSSSDGLKSLLLNYFETSAEASDFCTRLLETLARLQSDYRHIAEIIDGGGGGCQNRFSELRSRVFLENPFPDLNGQNFEHIRGRHSSVLHRLRSNRKRVARKIRLVGILNRASGVCAAAACGLLAAAAVFLAAHTLGALLVGPAVLGLPVRPLGRKIRFNFRFLKCGRLRKLAGQLDVAAKGVYILNRDFDTMSRLVARLEDEIEHSKAMIRLCLDRREDKVCLAILKDIRKEEFGLRKQVEELEEHAYLCLVTINRARAMVANEISEDNV